LLQGIRGFDYGRLFLDKAAGLCVDVPAPVSFPSPVSGRILTDTNHIFDLFLLERDYNIGRQPLIIFDPRRSLSPKLLDIFFRHFLKQYIPTRVRSSLFFWAVIWTYGATRYGICLLFVSFFPPPSHFGLIDLSGLLFFPGVPQGPERSANSVCTGFWTISWENMQLGSRMRTREG